MKMCKYQVNDAAPVEEMIGGGVGVPVATNGGGGVDGGVMGPQAVAVSRDNVVMGGGGGDAGGVLGPQVVEADRGGDNRVVMGGGGGEGGLLNLQVVQMPGGGDHMEVLDGGNHGGGGGGGNHAVDLGDALVEPPRDAGNAAWANHCTAYFLVRPHH